jgi:hypothetical protein
MESSTRTYDDLSAIRGIGPARQRWLRDSFDAQSYQDMVGLSVDRIESKLKADGQIVSRTAIETWLAQARELAARSSRNPRSDPEPAAEPASRGTHSIAREDGWEPFASFVIEFQVHKAKEEVREIRTAIHHIESDTDTYWPGIETSQVCQWIADQLPADVQEQSRAVRREQPHRVRTPVAEKIKITQIRIFQPPQSSLSPQRVEAGKMFQGSVQRDHPFKLEVDFELDVAAAAGKARGPIECNAQSFAYDLANQTSLCLGDTGLIVLDDAQPTRTFALPPAQLQHGEYRLWVVVKPKEARFVAPDYVEVPVLHVV